MSRVTKRVDRSTVPVVKKEKIESLFSQLADADDPDTAYLEGIAALAEMLGIDPSADIRILVLLWKFDVSVTKPGQLSKVEFTNGMEKLGVDDVDKLKALLPSLDIGFLEQAEFRDLYKFAFQFSREGTNKTLEKDMVIALLPLILDTARAPHLPYFLEFLSQHKEQRVTLDQWDSFLSFNASVDVTMNNFVDTGAWPLLLDDYVEWRKKTATK